MTEPGLREVKRAATTTGLARAALRLADERGLDGFTIDDVAREAGYSRRTFANYFSCKEEAVVAAPFLGFMDLDRLLERLPQRIPFDVLVAAAEELPALPTTEEMERRAAEYRELHDAEPNPGLSVFIDGLERLVLSPIVTSLFHTAEQVAPLVASNPSLQPFLLSQQAAMNERIGILLARVDKAAEHRELVEILLGATVGALEALSNAHHGECLPGQDERVFHGKEPPDRKSLDDFPAKVHQIFNYLRHGFAH